MARLPFQPDRIQPDADAGGKSQGDSSEGGDGPLTVSQVAGLVRGALAAGLPAKLQVIGQVSNFSGRGHWFFSLKDENGSLRCVCFASAARRIGFEPVDGLEVIATGRIDYYDAQGQLQLYVDQLKPLGQGELEARFKALCQQLRQEGYFDIDRKKPLPLVPGRVAVVTSRSGAALQDVINTAERRWAGCQLMLLDVRVQGETAAAQIALAIQSLSRDSQRLGIDAIILTRGGGSMEDLWPFNERAVADAVYQCPVPLVAAIGHETDTTVAELVADVRCATPTQAAMTLIPDATALGHQVDQLARRLTLLLKRRYEHDHHRLRTVINHPVFSKPQRLRDVAQTRLENLTNRLTGQMSRILEATQNRLAALGNQLQAVGPMNVLGRGYCYTLNSQGKLIRHVTEVEPGDLIETVLIDGKFQSQVRGSGDEPASPPPHTPPHTHPTRRKSAVPKHRRSVKGLGQPGLFEPNP